MQRGLWGWDGANYEWVKALVDAAGHLQVDVLSGVGVASQCYGWDTVDWQRLRVEGAANPNLRVAIYDGANRTHIRQLTATSLADALYALNVSACLRVSDTAGATWKEVVGVASIADGIGMGSGVPVGLWGYNGAMWDRLRTYGTGVLTVAKGAIAPTRIRMTATGRVGVAGAKKLFWVACSPDAVNAEWELTDADAGGSAVVYDHFDQDRSSEQLDFDPPMEFATGIWVEKFDHMKSLVFCYI